MQYRWTVLSVTTIGVLISQIDQRILIVGLPVIAAFLRADAEQAIWFTQGYSLLACLLSLFAGRASDMFGKVRLFQFSFIIFTVASFLCSLSRSPYELIGFRMIQGSATGMIYPIASAMIVDATPPTSRGFSLGINSVAGRIGSVFGLSFSGIMLGFFSWQWLFYINIPIGIFGIVWGRLRLKEIGVKERGSTMDWIGFAEFTIFLGTLLLGLTYAAYSLSLPVWLFLAASAVSFAVFLVQQRKAEHPLLDLKLFKLPQFTASQFSNLLIVVATTSLLLLLSLYLQLVEGLSPLQTGVRLIPYDIILMCVGPLSGRWSDRFGQMPFMIGGISVVTASIFMFYTLTSTTPYFYVAAYLSFLGLGFALFASPNSSRGFEPVPPNRRGVASGVRNLTFSLGNTLSLNLIILVMAFTIPYGLLSTVISSGSASAVPLALRDLFLASMRNTFLAFGGIGALAFVPTLLAGKPKRVVASPDTKNLSEAE
jgi:EmrB/QacA subfamily drug resistance transporter